MALEAVLDAYTGCGVLVLFEPDEVAPHAGTRSDWYTSDEVLVALANAGLVVPINVKVDGVWLCRLTFGDLTDQERRAVLQSDDRYWIDIKGREVAFGGLEALPQQNQAPHRLVDEFGDRVTVEPGRYKVTIYRLVGHHDDNLADEIKAVDKDIPAYVIACRSLPEGEQPPILESLPNFSPNQQRSG